MRVKEWILKMRNSRSYILTEMILGSLCVLFTAFIGWHFTVVFQKGYIIVGEPNHLILLSEAYFMVPFVLFFGFLKFVEDIILIIIRGREAGYIISELGLGIFFLADMSFIQYHFTQIVSYGKSTISVEGQELLIIVLAVLLMGFVLSACKIIEDVQDFKKIIKKAGL